MSRVFVDTSGILAFLVASDAHHAEAASTFTRLAAERAALLTTSYVLVETYALLGRRVGVRAVRGFREQFAPLLEVVWVDAAFHDRGLDLLLARPRRRLSLVDAVSFAVMRARRVVRAFAFDRDFEREGFEAVD